jgi:hypothetical protein
MLKNIKKSLKYLIIFIGIIIMVPTVLYTALQVPEVQTFLVNRISSHISQELKSSISVGRFEYKFFNKISLNDVLIKDQNNDTLLYTQKITAVLKYVSLKSKFFHIGRVMITNPIIALATDSTGLMNLTWYINQLNNSADTTKNSSIKLSIDQIDISSGRFSMINHSGKKGNSPLDFNNLNINALNGIIEDFKIQNDTTVFNIYNLGFKESSGFTLKRMTSTVKIAKQNFQFNSTSLNCDSSILNISRLEIKADSSSSFKNFSEEVKLNILLEKSLLSSRDLQYFTPFPKELNESIWLSGRVYGTISELRGRNIWLSYRDFTTLDCDFDFSGLPKIENAFIYIGVNSLETNAKDIEKINIPGKGLIIVPDILYKLGNISFNGSFTGFTTDFVTYGEVRTSQGNIRTDISLRPEESKKYRVKGLLTGSNINLGELTGNTDLLGKLSMQTNVDGYAYSLKKFAANLTGKIDSIEINRYEYRNISLNGFFTEKTWDGSINIVDRNIKLDLLGLLNFKNKLPEFDFTLNIADANLYKLNFDRLDTTASATMLLTANFKGNSIDNLDGEIKLLNSSFKKYNKTLELYDFSIRTFTENNKPVLSLRTDFVDADIRGYYNFAALGGLVKSTLTSLMPSQFKLPARRNDLKKNKFTYAINFKNTDKISSFFRTGVLLADKSYINGIIYPDSLISVAGLAKSLSVKNNVFKDLTVDAKIIGSVLSAEIKSSSLTLLKQSDLKGFSVKLSTRPDNFIFTVDWDNKDNILNRGNFVARGSIAKSPSGNTNTILMVNIDSTDIYSRNNRWRISKSSILVDSNAVHVNKLSVYSTDHYYMVDGSVSEDPSDTLHLKFKGIDISPLNYLVNQNKNDPAAISMDMKGSLDGKILLTNIYRNLLLAGNIIVNNFSILGSELGNISIESNLNNAKKVVNINASNNLGGIKMIDITGYYDPSLKKLDLNGIATRLPIDALNPLLKVFASGITGTTSGKVNLTSEPGKIILKGAAMAENASMKIDYLQTRYKLNDTIRFDKSGIKFNSVKITDEKGNNATLSGTVYHKNFKEYSADIVVNMNNNECLVLNTKPKDNELFYGTAYASGLTTIKSGPGSLSFDISAKTGRNTRFYIPLNNGLSVSEYSFITFVDSSSAKDGIAVSGETHPAPTPKKLGMDLNFDLEVTPEAEVQLIFDPKVGDVMKGHGSGNLNISMNKKGEFKMAGDYIIEDGDYLFTLGNVFNKSFTVENGGKIMFNGDIYNTEIDIKAIYKLKASLDKIFGDENYNKKIPVECQMNLTGKLFNPVVEFNIYLPSSDEQTRTYLSNAISTEEELSRQFLSLLMMNDFISLGSTSGSGNISATAAGTSAMAATTWEMVSNQISNMLSKINNDFNIGFVYRPGYDAINPQEVEFALSTQVLDDKLVINSNIDLRGAGTAASNNSNNTNQITGDFDIEYKITEKIRFKAFNRSNNQYTRIEPYTQGIGIFYKQDFDKLSDLFRKKVKSEMKKEDTPAVKQE